MKIQSVEIELTKDWQSHKKGEVLTRSRDIANIHMHQLKNAKLYVKKKAKKKGEKSK